MSGSLLPKEEDTRVEEPIPPFDRRVPRGTPALYMDAREQEILLPRGIRYTIQEIVHSPAGEFLPDDEALVYILSTIR